MRLSIRLACVRALFVSLFLTLSFPATAADPEVQWSFSADSQITSSPAVAADGVSYITTQNGTLYAVNSNGSKRWEYKAAGKGYSPSIAPDGTIYFTSSDGFLHAVAPDGQLKWKLAAASPSAPPISDVALGPDGAIYFSSGDNNLYRALPNGTVDWTRPVVRNQSGVSVDNDGTIYFQQSLESDGTRAMIAFDPSGTALWTNNSPTFSLYVDPVPPAIDNNHIYVTDSRILTALNKSGAVVWRHTNMLGNSLGTPSLGADGSVRPALLRMTINRNQLLPGGLASYSTTGTSNWHAPFGPDIPGSVAITADGRSLASGYFKTALIISADGQSATNLAIPGLIDGYSPTTQTSPTITSEGIGYLCVSNVLVAIELDSPLANSAWPMHGANPFHTRRPAYTGNDIVIVQNPTSQTVTDESALTLAVAAQSGLALSYQWFFADAPLSGETSSTYQIPSVGTNHADAYYVVASNSGISKTSTVAQVTVHYSLGLTASAGGTVGVTPNATSFLPDTSLSITATPSANFLFTGWSGDVTGSANPLSITIQSNTVIHANFAPAVTLQATAGTGGLVEVDPSQSLYLVGSEVEVTAIPNVGYAFQNWSGASSSTVNPLTLTLTAASAITANFVDIADPLVSITTPAHESTTTNKNFTLTGTATDNGTIATAAYTLNGGPQVSLSITGGGYTVPGLVLQFGTNTLQVTLTDSAGNDASVESIVVWDPPRIFTLPSPASLQEGTEFDIPIDLSSGGEVNAATFKVTFDTNYLTLLSTDWNNDLLSGALRQINTSVPGEITGSFALPGTAIPSGDTNLATISLRARSVPNDLETTVSITIDDVSSDSGDPLPQGNAGVSATVEITQRNHIADNNANDLYDVGDATIIQRLLAALDPVRAWDVPLNDLNSSSTLDSGDVTRVLRAVVGLDPQPPAPSPKAKSSAQRRDLAQAGPGFVLSPVNSEVRPGETLTYSIGLEGAGAISGLSFTLNYDPAVLRLTSSASYSVGPYIIPTAFLLWNSGAPGNNFSQQTGRLSLGASAAQPWTGSSAVAQVTFVVQQALQTTGSTDVTLANAKITSNGFHITDLPTVRTMVHAEQPNLPTLDPSSIAIANGQLTITFASTPGHTYRVEASSDFETWTNLGAATVSGNQAQFTTPVVEPFQFYKISVSFAD